MAKNTKGKKVGTTTPAEELKTPVMEDMQDDEVDSEQLDSGTVDTDVADVVTGDDNIVVTDHVVGDVPLVPAPEADEMPATEDKVEEQVTAAVVEPVIETPVVETPVVEVPVVEEVKAVDPTPAPTAGMICTWDRGIDGQLKFALDTLNGISSRDIAGICNARYMIYTNLFNGIGNAASDEDANSLINNFLDAMSVRPYVISKDRALLGFLRMDKLSRQQANMYQTYWSMLVDTAIPATRKLNSLTINWKMIGAMSGYHKRGDVIQRRMFAFYQRC